jgi:hypothetical protein
MNCSCQVKQDLPPSLDVNERATVEFVIRAPGVGEKKEDVVIRYDNGKAWAVPLTIRVNADPPTFIYFPIAPQLAYVQNRIVPSTLVLQTLENKDADEWIYELVSAHPKLKVVAGSVEIEDGDSDEVVKRKYSFQLKPESELAKRLLANQESTNNLKATTMIRSNFAARCF